VVRHRRGYRHGCGRAGIIFGLINVWVLLVEILR